MQHIYNSYHSQARQLENNLKPALSSDNYQSRQLRYELRGLQQDLAMKKNPRAIDARMKGIQDQVGTMNRMGSGLGASHTANLHQNMATMRMGMQRMPRYYKK